ncbi:Endophilin-A2, partial [Eschrichtius robustus]|nr:Endophilin-A2 [Eschrichtius robustus]
MRGESNSSHRCGQHGVAGVPLSTHLHTAAHGSLAQLGAAEPPAQPDQVGTAREGFRQEEPLALGLQERVGLERELVRLPVLPLAATFSIPGKPSWTPEPSPSSPEAHTLFPTFIPQLVSEKVGGAEGTKLDDDFKEMEKKVDVTSKAVTEVLARTIEYLQPNPASRAKLTMLNTVSKIRGQVKNPGYPQSEGLLGECMIRHGKELGGESNFGDALLDAGESMKRLAEVKDSLDIEVKQNFIDPLQNLCDKDLKEIQKKRQGKIPDEELRQAMEKFEESKEVAETSMHNLLETDIEQVSQLSALVDAQLDYHRQAVQILDELADKLKRRMREASSRPKREYKPKPREPLDLGEPEQSNGGFPCATAPKITASSSFRSSDKPTRTPSSRSMRAGDSLDLPPPPAPLDQPSCKALYDFEPENDGELGFHEGDIITLTNQIDENWYEGMLHGQSGFFPLSYVEVLVPLPQ